MTPREWIRIAWGILMVIWIIASRFTKSTSRRQSSGSLYIHLALIVLAFALLFGDYFQFPPFNIEVLPAIPWTGLALVVVGLAFCVWARFYLGGNWSGTVTVKKDHTLIRGGPYAMVRHPIYSGMLLAMLGTALSNGELRGLLGFAIGVVDLKRKSMIEEGFMMEQFGSQYEAYRHEVKGLIPGVW